MKLISVKEFMSEKPEYISPTTTLFEAATKMKKQNVGFLPVGENDRLVGAVTDRDIIIRALASSKDLRNTKVSDIMSLKIEWCFESENLLEAIKHMSEKNIHRLVVLNKEKRLCGILSLGDIARKTKNKNFWSEVFFAYSKPQSMESTLSKPQLKSHGKVAANTDTHTKMKTKTKSKSHLKAA